MSKRSKNAALEMSLANLGSIALVAGVFILFLVSPAFANLKKMVVGEKTPAELKQIDDMIDYINADIENIKIAATRYPISIDGTKYQLFIDSCSKQDAEGRCTEGKTKICLRRIESKDICSKKRLNFDFNESIYQIPSENIFIGWDRSNKKLTLSSS